MNDNSDIDFANDSSEFFDSKSAGRWTSEEHTLFLKGLQLYNKQWKFIADLVKTRTVVQIRTHAQKYFQKLEKGKMAGMKKDGLNLDSSMPEFKNASSRTSSISSSDSFTTSEGESDSERGMSIGSMEDSSHLMITLPNPTKPRSNSKTKADSPKKRSRDGKPAENKPKGGKKSVDDTIDFPIPHDMGVNGDVLFDFMQLDNYEAGDDLDHSIINLLEKIDWNVPGSRPHSPFMDSANLVTVSMDSWDGSETNSQLSDFHPMQTGFLADIGIDTVPSSNNSNSFSNIPNLQPTSLLADSVPSVDSKTSSSLKELTKPSLISDNCNSTFGLPLVSPTAISAPHVYSPVASSNHLCEEPNTQKDGEFGSFPFDNDEPDGDNDFSQPKKRGRSIDPIISATNFALTENKSGMLVAANENIGDKFEDLLDSGILLDSF